MLIMYVIMYPDVCVDMIFNMQSHVDRISKRVLITFNMCK